MTDLEITKLCAEAMGLQHHVPRDAFDGEFWVMVIGYSIEDIPFVSRYDPLHDDEQAMALVKKFRLSVFFDHENGHWCVSLDLTGEDICNADLNRAACMCVSKMESKK